MSGAKNNFQNKYKKIAGIHERADALEEALQEFGQGVERAIKTLQNQVSNMTEILDAVVASIGDKEVTDIVLQNRRERKLADEAKRKDSIAVGLEKGTIKVVDVVKVPAEGEDPNKYLIAIEEIRNSPDGKEPLREKIEGSFIVTTVTIPQFKDKLPELLGKPVGTEFEAGKLPDGAISTAVIVGLYERVPAPTIAVPPAPLAVVPDAQAQSESSAPA